MSAILPHQLAPFSSSYQYGLFALLFFAVWRSGTRKCLIRSRQKRRAQSNITENQKNTATQWQQPRDNPCGISNADMKGKNICKKPQTCDDSQEACACVT